MWYDYLYQGQSKGAYDEPLGAGVVLQICSSLPARTSDLIVTDNYFKSPNLVNEVPRPGIYFVAAVRENRLKTKLKHVKQLRIQGRGSMGVPVATGDCGDIAAARWYDN